MKLIRGIALGNHPIIGYLLLQILFSINFRHIFVTFIVFGANLRFRRELLLILPSTVINRGLQNT